MSSPVTHSSTSSPTAHASPLRKLAKVLLQCDEMSDHLDSDMLHQLNAIVAVAHKNLCDKAGQFLHKLNDEKHTQDQVKAVIRIFPSALFHIGEKGRLPIQRAVRKDRSVSFIPILAQAGSHLDVGGKGNRGGLLLPVPGTPSTYENMLQILVNTASPTMDNTVSDNAHLQVLKRLRAMNLFQKRDIANFCLLLHACYPNAQQRFVYLYHWHPKALMTTISPSGYPLIHASMNHSLQSFSLALRAGIDKYPLKLGNLFKKDKEGMTACWRAILLHGSYAVLTCVKECIPPSGNFPILHYVAEHIPQLMDEFAAHYPNAHNLRDGSGRSLFHCRLVGGGQSLMTNTSLIDSLTDNEVAEKDPVTGLYPFMLAASVGSDLTTIYKLLSRSPDAIKSSQNSGAIEFGRETLVMQKRKWHDITFEDVKRIKLDNW